MGIKKIIKLFILRAQFRSKQYKSYFLYKTNCIPIQEQPKVAVFISNLNTLAPLKLTIKSLLQHTNYKNVSITIADNASTDGSREFLKKLDHQGIIQLYESNHPCLHSYWVNWALRSTDAKYIIFVDSDMYFLGSDWLSDIVKKFESDPIIGIVSGEPKPQCLNYVEPVSHKIVDSGETPCTWLFAIRTSIREEISTSFEFTKTEINPATGNLLVYDTGGLFLKDMQEKGYTHAIMPHSFTNKWHHFGSLSWFSDYQSSKAYLEYKDMQLTEIRRIAENISL